MNKQAYVSDRQKTAACTHERRERPELSISDLRLILDRLGFDCRVRGDHFIYTRKDIEEIINIQPVGSKAKPYQCKQVRQIILKYDLGGALNEV